MSKEKEMAKLLARETGWIKESNKEGEKARLKCEEERLKWENIEFKELTMAMESEMEKLIVHLKNQGT